MTIVEVLEELGRHISNGEVTFAQVAVTATAGNVNFWIETVHPKFDVSPLEYLSSKKFLPEDPPYGLSWEDYHTIVDASHGSNGEKDPCRLKLVVICKAIKKIRILGE